LERRRAVRVLVDMDGVLTDFESGFLDRWRELYADRIFIPIEQRTTFYIADQYPQEWKESVYDIFEAPGFYRSLRPIPGGVEALRAMQATGIEVFVCSSPLTEYKNCVLEKYEWIDEHLGKDWTKNLILAKDKTVIKADFLIDDRPQVKGAEEHPSWQHILYDAPYNRGVIGKKRLDWENWRAVLPNGLPSIRQ